MEKRGDVVQAHCYGADKSRQFLSENVARQAVRYLEQEGLCQLQNVLQTTSNNYIVLCVLLKNHPTVRRVVVSVLTVWLENCLSRRQKRCVLASQKER